MISSNVKMSAEIDTPNGKVYIEGPVMTENLKVLTMDEKLVNFRSPERQHEALCTIADSSGGFVYIARNDRLIVGYLVFHYPSQFSRWSKHPRILELGSIEISSEFKRMGIGSLLLKTAFRNPVMEEYIVITTEFFWHWDLNGSGLDVWNYQRMLSKLFGSVHFKKKRTDDPEILEHPANMLMVRLGKKIPDSYLKNFDEMLYQQSLVE